MLESVTGADIAALVSLMRAAFKGTIVVVEGDTDARVFEKLLNKTLCQVVVARCKANALAAIESLEAEGFQGVVAIVDADFMRLRGQQPTSGSVLLTDWHDLEIILIESGAFEAVLREYGSKTKLSNLRKRNPLEPRKTVYGSARPFGALRLLSESENLALRFEGLDFGRPVDRGTLVVDTAVLVMCVLSRSERSVAEKPRILEQLAEICEDRDVDSRELCSGHDVVAILSIGLRKLLGSNDARRVRPDELERALRLAFDPSEFKRTRLYTDLQSWEAANDPFRLI
jgi:hypothetical protein